MNEFELYSKFSICTKCGCSDVSANYCGGWDKDRTLSCRLGVGHKEHITRYCRNCGFRWNEACLNGPKLSTPEKFTEQEMITKKSAIALALKYKRHTCPNCGNTDEEEKEIETWNKACTSIAQALEMVIR